LTVNLASGCETSMSELAHHIADRLGGHVDVAFSGVTRPGDPIRWCADVNLLEKFGFTAEVSLSEGLKRFVEWVRCEANE